MLEQNDYKSLETSKAAITALDNAFKAILWDSADALFEALSCPEIDVNSTKKDPGREMDDLFISNGTKRLANGTTLLECAVLNKSSRLVKLLLEMGANPYQTHSNTNLLHVIDLSSDGASDIEALIKEYQGLTSEDAIKNYNIANLPSVLSGEMIKRELDDALKHKIFHTISAKASQQLLHVETSTLNNLLDNGVVYTDLACYEGWYSGLEFAVVSEDVERVKILLARGACMTTPVIQQCLKDQDNPAYQTIKKLFDAEKNRQLDILHLAASLNAAPLPDDTIKCINAYYASDTEKCGLTSDEKTLCAVLSKLREMRQNSIILTGEKKLDLLAEVINLTSHVNLNLSVRTSPTPERHQALIRSLVEAKHRLGRYEHRHSLDILAHILFVLLTLPIGAAVVCGHKYYRGTFFLNETNRQKQMQEVIDVANQPTVAV